MATGRNTVSAVTLAKSMAAPQETNKKDYHIIQQFHAWVLIPKQAKTRIQNTYITCSPCSALLTTAEIRRQLTCLLADAWIKIRRGVCHTTSLPLLYIMEYYAVTKRVELCHLPQHGWTERELSSKISRVERDKDHRISLTCGIQTKRN